MSGVTPGHGDPIGPLDWLKLVPFKSAAVSHSPFHFARQFKAATGLPPYQFVIARRVERAKQLLQADESLSLAQIAARAGFADQSKFSHHFKRSVGVTPQRFRTRARFAQEVKFSKRGPKAWFAVVRRKG